MTLKKNTLKAMCTVLTCTTLLSGLLVANATDVIVTENPIDNSSGSESDWNIEESNFEEIEVTYKQASSYSVSIPKAVVLDANKQAAYSIKVTGSIDTNQRVFVAPVDGITDTEEIDFYMKDQTSNSKKSDVVASVTQNKYYWNCEDVVNGYEEANNSISAPDLTFGTWKGSFQMEIRLESNTSHIHNYVDGKCECGAIDPNHTHNYADGTCTICGEKDPNAEHVHNYIDGKCECGEVDSNHTHNYGEDGTCTICGKEVDPYEMAPASAYSNWNYTLDDENEVVTLNYYTGSETNVIVYGNYEIDGKRYKTKIASNVNPQDSKELYPYMFNGYVHRNCQNIKSIVFSKNIDTSNVTDMDYMFNQCKGITSLDFSSLDTSNVTSMKMMFRNCASLTTICGLDTSNVTNMNYMFGWCSSLVNPDLSSFDTRKVTDMSGMFFYCTRLTMLDLSSFDTNEATVIRSMFGDCSNLKTIYVAQDKWGASDDATMFSRCGTTSLTYK